MFEITLQLHNDDLDAVEEWVKTQLTACANNAVAPYPTKGTGMATTQYVMLCAMRRQIKDHRAMLAQRAKSRRRK